jgi:hypothetical protein
VERGREEKRKEEKRGVFAANLFIPLSTLCSKCTSIYPLLVFCPKPKITPSLGCVIAVGLEIHLI